MNRKSSATRWRKGILVIATLVCLTGLNLFVACRHNNQDGVLYKVKRDSTDVIGPLAYQINLGLKDDYVINPKDDAIFAVEVHKNYADFNGDIRKTGLGLEIRDKKGRVIMRSLPADMLRKEELHTIMKHKGNEGQVRFRIRNLKGEPASFRLISDDNINWM